MVTEKRLIDANALLRRLQKRREDFASGWRTLDSMPDGAKAKYEENLACSLIIEDCPTVDAVEVVRCKDCKYWKDSWVAPDGKHEHGYCYMEDADDVVVGRWGDDFCSYGERRTE